MRRGMECESRGVESIEGSTQYGVDAKIKCHRTIQWTLLHILVFICLVGRMKEP